MLPVSTGDRVLDGAERVALRVISGDAIGGKHIAAPYYNSAWIRDSFAWGMVPWSTGAGSTLNSYATSELQYWLSHPNTDGLWITNDFSGWYDETPALIGAVADAYRITGNSHALLDALPKVEAAWRAMRRAGVQGAHGSQFLLYANVNIHIASDWADQIARRGYATGLEALWYHATTAMAAIETAAGHPDRATHYAYFARGVAQDINRLLWRTSAPFARNAPAVPAFGHYTGWLGPRDYFELDSNFLCILYGIATPRQAASIIGFTKAHSAYLLEEGVPGGMPARVLYGDYDPRDYARIHNKIADGIYQNAYWPSVGALVAIGLASKGDNKLANELLRHIAQGMLGVNDASEWYQAGGKAAGAAAYQWPARMYIIALYAVYLGLDDNWLDTDDRGAFARNTHCASSGTAYVQSRGTRYRIQVQQVRWAGSTCTVQSARVSKKS